MKLRYEYTRFLSHWHVFTLSWIWWSEKRVRRDEKPGFSTSCLSIPTTGVVEVASVIARCLAYTPDLRLQVLKGKVDVVKSRVPCR